MANTYKNIVITPNIGNTADPKIQFSGGNTTVNTDISMFVYPSSNGTLSFEGSAGQLFSITNDLSGSLFSVNDVSGIPSLEVFANGLVSVAPLGGNVVFGNTSELILSSGAGLYANDSLGTAGQVLHSNGSSVYWAADDNTNTTYDLLHIANTVANEGRIRLKDVNNSNDDVVIVGAGGVTVSSNSTAVLVTSVIGDITSVTAGDGLTGGGSTGDVTLNVGAGTGITVSADAVAVNAAYIATITANNSTFINGNTVVTVMESLRANRNISGGGTIAVDGSYNVLWPSRFIVMANGRGTHFSTTGYFDITCPTSGTITGVGGAPNKTATAAGIPLAAWEALYYILPIGSNHTSVAANFRVVNYQVDVEIPSDWILICIRNSDTGQIHFNNGVTLTAGQSYNTVSFNSAVAPYANNSGNLNSKTEGNLNVNNAATATNSTQLGGVAAASYVQNTDSRTLSGNINFTSTNTFFNAGLTANGDIKIGTASSTETSGVGYQRFFSKSVAAGQLHRLCKYLDTEGTIQLLITVSSETGGNSGTSTYLWQGGYGSLGGANGWYRLLPVNTGRGHGDDADTGENSNAWNVLIYGTTITGSAYEYGVAVSVPAGRTGKTLKVTITELKRGMIFTDESSIAVVTSWTIDGTIYSHRNLLVEGNVGIGTSTPAYKLDVTGTAYASSSLRAPIFYDSDNTAYYMDLNSTSRLNVLQFASGATNGPYFNYGNNQQNLYLRGSSGADIGVSLFDVNNTWRGQLYASASGYGFLASNWGLWDLQKISAGKLYLNNQTTYYIDTSEIYYNRVYGVTDIRSPIFYDNNDTAYYVDPASTSDAAVRIRGGAYFGPNVSWSEYLYVGGNGRVGTSATVATTNGNLHLDAKDGFSTYLNWYSQGSIFTGTSTTVGLGNSSASHRLHVHGTGLATTDFRAPIFYDSADTAFYLDPASTTTSLQIAGAIEQGNNIARPNIEWQATGASTGMVIFSLPGASGNYGMVHMVFDIYEYVAGKIATVIVGGHNWNGAWYETGCQVIGNLDKTVRLGFKDGKYCVVFGGAASTWTYGTIRLRKIHNGGFYNNIMDLGGAYTATQTTTESFTAVTADLRQLRTPGTFQADSDIRAPIFYDSNNTAFYVDPASGSSIKRLFVDTTNVDPSEVSGAALGNIYEPTTSWSAPGIAFGSGAGSHGAIGYGSGQMYFASENGSDNTLNSRMTLSSGGTLSVTTDVRAPIFYDTNNTAYYLDPLSTSNLNTVQAVDAFRSDRFEDLDGNFFFREGALSGVTRHLNLSDSTADPSAISADVGITWGARSDNNPYYMIWTLNYDNGLTTHSRLRLGWHTGMEIGAAPNYGGIRFFSNSPGIAGAAELMSIGKSDTHVRVVNNLYSKIYYDIDNTAFYVDPAATSNLSALNVGSIGWNSIVPVFGQRGMYLNELVDILYQADKRFTVTNGNAAYFDGNFDSSVTIPVNTTRVININIAGQSGIPGSGITYCSGVILVSFYYTANLYSSLSLRVRNNAGTWTSAAAPTNISTNASYKVMAFTVPIGNYLTDIELTVVTDATNEAWLASINYYTDRWTTELELPYVSKYLTSNYMFGNFGVKTNAGVINNLLNGTGNSYLAASTGSVGIGNAAPAHKLDVTGTAYASVDVRAPIFYDSVNTGYYVDPASTSNLNGLTVAATITGSIQYITGGIAPSTDHYMNFRVMRNLNATTTDGMYIGYGNAGSTAGITRIFGGGATNGEMTKYADRTEEPGSFRAPIFYDVNNTAYYVDPATGTNLNGTLINNGGTAMTGGWNRSLLLNAMFPVIVFNSNNTKYSGIGVDYSAANAGFYFWVNGNSTDINNGSASIAMQINTGNFVSAAGSFRAPIFYDSDNTAYYVNPADATTSAILNGKVGIGNTTPAHTLRVQGDISLSGGVHANGSLGTSGHILTTNGTGSYWAAANVANVTGVLPINNGGTNSTATPTQYGIAYGTGTAYAFTAQSSIGQFLYGLGSVNPPVWVTLDLDFMPEAWVKKTVRVATTANITLSGTQTVDGVALVSGDRILVKNQTTASQNGIYIVLAGAWSRQDTQTNIPGAIVTVSAGNVNAGRTYRTDFKATDTFNSTAMNWYQVLDEATGATRSRAIAMSMLFG